MRAAPESTWRAGAVVAACVGLVAAAVFAGGLPGDSGTALVGIGAVAVVAVLAVSVPVPRIGRVAGLAVASLVALAGWAALSVTWSVAADRSWDAANLLFVDVLFLLLGILAAGALGGRAARGLLLITTAVLGAALVWALLGVAVPAWFPEGDRIARLREPIGHAPALALLAGAALPLAGLLAGERRAGARAAGGLLAFVAVVALLLTQSRAGLLAAVAALGLWAALTGAPATALARVGVPAVPALLVVAWVFTQDALVEDGSARADRVDTGAVFAVIAVAGALVAVVATLVVPVDRIARERPRLVRRAIVVTAAASLGIALAAVAVTQGNLFDWLGREISGGECANEPGRLLDPCANNRLDWWREAGEIFSGQPLRGTGAQTFAIARTQVRDSAEPVSEPHSVPLQVLADLGLVGFLLAAACAVALAASLAVAVRRLEGPERAAAAALVGLPLAFAIHSLFDYDADFVAVAAPTLLVCGGLVAASRPARPLPTSAAVPAAAAALVIASLLLPWLSGRAADGAFEAYGAGRPADAVRLADRASILNPLSFRARLTQALVAPDDDAAARHFTRLTTLQPQNAEAWYQLGLFELYTREDSCAAYVALNQAYTLDQMSDRWVKGGPLDQARRDVDENRACG